VERRTRLSVDTRLPTPRDRNPKCDQMLTLLAEPVLPQSRDIALLVAVGGRPIAIPHPCIFTSSLQDVAGPGPRGSQRPSVRIYKSYSFASTCNFTSDDVLL